MKIDKIKNTKKGLIFGLVYKFFSLLFPFLIQTVLIHQLGIEYIGIKGLFSSILTIFSLAELGFGGAIVYSMYKPIVDDDYEKICALLNLYRRAYRVIGFVILILGLAITPFLNFIIKGSHPDDISLEVVFLLYLVNTVLSYWLYGYKSSLLYAYQRMDMYNLIASITLVSTSLIQLIILFLAKSFYLFIIVSIFSTILNNFLISVFTNKLYPNLECRGKVDNETLKTINQKVSGLLIGRICGATRNSFDSIFLSAFIGLSITAMYSNYYFILTALNGITQILLNAMLGGVGNSIVINSKRKNYNDMIVLNNLYLVISGIMSICMLCLCQPFMNLWVGKDYIFPEYIMILFPIYFYIQKMGDIRGVYAEAAGLFWEDRWRCIFESIANIILNYFLGKYFGVLGIITATIFSLFFIGFLGSTIVIFKYYFKEGIKHYMLNQLCLMVCTFLIGIITYSICENIIGNNLFTLGCRAILCVTISAILYWLVLHKTRDYNNAKELMLKIVK